MDHAGGGAGRLKKTVGNGFEMAPAGAAESCVEMYGVDWLNPEVIRCRWAQDRIRPSRHCSTVYP